MALEYTAPEATDIPVEFKAGHRAGWAFIASGGKIGRQHTQGRYSVRAESYGHGFRSGAFEYSMRNAGLLPVA